MTSSDQSSAASGAARGSTYARVQAMSDDQRDALTEQFTKASRISTAEPIAVVGIGCRFPGGVNDPDQYWDLLMRSGDAVVEVPEDRWDAEAYYDADPSVPGRMPSKWGGFVDGIDGFDAEHFGIAPREAEAMDPQQRMLLEVAWEALEHAGIAPGQIDGLRAAVMMGVYYNEYQAASVADSDTIDAYSATGNAHSVTVGRIAYLLGLRGPAVAVDTACSSSLVSVHLACQSLRSRETDLALAGGVSLILRPETQLALGKWGMLSPRGRCNAFDAAADGFVRGEGCGVVVLKRLTDAVRDGDRVLAVVRGSATNQDGRSNGLTAPNAPAQSEVLTRALGDVPAASINFVETHGTGTGIGDPIEFDALARVYGAGESRCALGAVKTNMGHLEAAAGIAGFIKSVLVVNRGKVPPNLHFSQWNPAIDASRTRLFVPTEPDPWPSASGPRRAGVSSFGLGGTNAHVVIEQGPDPMPLGDDGDARSVCVLSVGGTDDAAVRDRARALAQWLEGRGARSVLRDVAHTVARQSAGAPLTATVSARDHREAVAGLRALATGESRAAVLPAGAGPGPGVVFAYSGQGAQWPGMGRRLLVDEPEFAAAVDRYDADFVEQVGFSLRSALESDEPIEGIDRIQPVLVGVQLALTDLWRAHGVTPDAVIGHSMGEVTAAIVAGGLSVADGLRVIATRSRLMRRDLSGQGAMALLEMDAQAVESLLTDHDGVSIAVIASPRQTVVAGPPDRVDEVVEAVSRRNLLARRVEVDVASHHATVDPILPELRQALAGIAPVPPRIPVLSTVRPGDESPVFDAEYWVSNLRQPVRFAEAATAATSRYGAIVEVSPHPLLAHAITESGPEDREVLVLPTLLRGEDEALVFHAHRARLGGDLPPGHITDIAPHTWRHRKYWTPAPAHRLAQPDRVHPLLGSPVEIPSGGGFLWHADVGLDEIGWLADHRVQGQAIMPAAGFAEIALAAGRTAYGTEGAPAGVDQLEVEQMLPLTGSVPLTTRLTYDSDGSGRVEIFSRGSGGEWIRHATARVGAGLAQRDPSPVAPVTSGVPVSPREVYAALRRAGAHHDRAFAALQRVSRDPVGAAEADVTLPAEATRHPGLVLHPVALDAALQTLAAALPESGLEADAAYLPVSVESIRLYAPVGRDSSCRARFVSLSDEGATGDVTITDRSGALLAEIRGVFLRRIRRHAVPLPLERKLFGHRWEESAAPDGIDGSGDGAWLLLSDDRPGVEAIASDLHGAGRRIVTADFGEQAVADAIAEVASDPDYPPTGIVLLLDAETDDATAADRAAVAERLTWQVATAVSAVTSGWHGRPPRLWLVTRRGLEVAEGDVGTPAVGALTGLIRVLAYEHPDLRATLVDLSSVDDVAATLLREASAPVGDDLLAWRDGRRYVQRLVRADPEPREGSGNPTVRSDGAYVVTGGMGGIGLAVARHLVAAGAGRIVLCGRSELSEDGARVLAELAADTEVVYVSGDVAADGVAESLVTAAEETGLPLRGVIHSAAVLDDELVTAMSRDALARVWRPKVMGAVRLDEATADSALDWLVLFSSVASLLGSPGQGAYAAANAYLDALAERRRAEGARVTSICWGQWSEVGLARSLEMSVLDPIAPDEGMEALDALLGGGRARVGVARLRLDRAAAAFPELVGLGYFTHLAAELDPDEDTEAIDLDRLRTMPFAEAHRLVLERLQKRIGAVLGYSGTAVVPAERALTELGLDSLMAVRIRNTVRSEFGVEPPVALLLQGAGLDDLATDLVRRLGVTEAPVHTSDATPADGLRGRAQQRVAARRRASVRRKVDHP